MSHQSGLYHIRQMIDVASRMLDWEHMIRAIEKASPAHKPGTRTGYHGLTYGFIIGAPRVELPRAAQLIAPRLPTRLAVWLSGCLAVWQVSNIHI